MSTPEDRRAFWASVKAHRDAAPALVAAVQELLLEVEKSDEMYGDVRLGYVEHQFTAAAVHCGDCDTSWGGEAS